MVPRRWQALRFLRVLLTCAILAFAARPSTPAPVWAEVPVLIMARAAVAPPGATRPRAAHAAHAAITRAAPPTRAPRPPADTPAPEASTRVLVPQRYLRNCALLC